MSVVGVVSVFIVNQRRHRQQQPVTLRWTSRQEMNWWQVLQLGSCVCLLPQQREKGKGKTRGERERETERDKSHNLTKFFSWCDYTTEQRMSVQKLRVMRRSRPTISVVETPSVRLIILSRPVDVRLIG